MISALALGLCKETELYAEAGLTQAPWMLHLCFLINKWNCKAITTCQALEIMSDA